MEEMKDPLNDRMVKSVRPPPHKFLTSDLIWKNDTNKPDWQLIRSHLQSGGRISKEDFVKIINLTNQITKKEPNLLFLSDPITVVGDLHGQFHDELKALELAHTPGKQKILFMGDQIDRGYFGIECVILNYCLKVNYPDKIYILRGNHENRWMSSYYNFRDECIYKYDQEIYDILMDSFDLLPLACIINAKFLALHGGISPDLQSLEDIKNIDRFCEPPKSGLYCDLLWSDPVAKDDGKSVLPYTPNTGRGCSYYFGIDAVNRFLEDNNLLTIIRGHEAQLDGYKIHRWENTSEFPSVITIFSCPNYCDVYNNKGSILKIQNFTLNIVQYNYNPHPYLLPHFMDVFTWSLPFIAEKVTEILYSLMKLATNVEKKPDGQFEVVQKKSSIQFLEQSPEVKDDQDAKDQLDRIAKEKVKITNKLQQMHQQMRKQNEDILINKQVPMLKHCFQPNMEDTTNPSSKMESEKKLNNQQ